MTSGCLPVCAWEGERAVDIRMPACAWEGERDVGAFIFFGQRLLEKESNITSY